MAFEYLSLDALEKFAQEYGYWTVFGGIFLENMGFPLPGETVTVVGGFLAGNGELSYWGVLGSAFAGATLGNCVGYQLGEWGGWPLLVKLGGILRVQEQQLEALRQRFRNNAVKAVIIARFVPLLRMLSGVMAGISQMPYRQFLLCNIGGAAAWASFMVTLSFFLGRFVAIEQLTHSLAKLSVVIVLLVVAWIVVPLWWETRKANASAEE